MKKKDFNGVSWLLHSPSEGSSSFVWCWFDRIGTLVFFYWWCFTISCENCVNVFPHVGNSSLWQSILCLESMRFWPNQHLSWTIPDGMLQMAAWSGLYRDSFRPIPKQHSAVITEHCHFPWVCSEMIIRLICFLAFFNFRYAHRVTLSLCNILTEDTHNCTHMHRKKKSFRSAQTFTAAVMFVAQP